MADGSIIWTQTKFSFLVVSFDLSITTDGFNLIERVGSEFKSAVARNNWLNASAKQAWDFISSWKAFGVEYKKEGTSEISKLDDLCSTIVTFLNKSGDTVDGILILIDEADKAGDQINLAEFVKAFTEKLTRLRCERVCLGLAGLPTLTQKLRAGHESSLRIFESWTLDPIEHHECEQIIDRALHEASAKGDPVTISDEAKQSIVRLSEGYPHFVQQFGYCAFEADADSHITQKDVDKGAFAENGALDQLGKRFFSEMYFNKVSSEDYRKCLNAMANHGDEWVARSVITKEAGIKETQVNNALVALRGRNIILLNDQKKGEYRLPTRSFAAWIKALLEKQSIAKYRDDEQAPATI